MIFVILLRYLPLYILFSVIGYFIVKHISKRLVRYYIAGVILAPTIDMIVGIVAYVVLSLFWVGTEVTNTAETDSFYMELVQWPAFYENDKYYFYIHPEKENKGFKSIEYNITTIMPQYGNNTAPIPCVNKYCRINYIDILYNATNRNKPIYCAPITQPTSRYMVKTSVKEIGTLGLREKIVLDRETGAILGKRRWLTNPLSFPFFASYLLSHPNSSSGNEPVFPDYIVPLEYLVLKSKQ